VNGGGGQRSSKGAWFDCGWEELGVGVAAVKGGRGVAPLYRAGGQEGRRCDKGGIVAGVVGCH
jgi:hypothetical protein